MIDSIELTNWKTHKETRMKFSRGTNILLGQMGAGKSSIMDAISFALFGTYPALQHKRVAVDEVIMNRPEQMRSASVSLEFGIDGANYSVKRNLELNGSTKATLQKDGAYLQSQPQRVNEEIERILKVDYELFSRAIYSEQNRLTYFLELRPAERKKQIDELLGLDKFAMAQENATSLANKIKDMVSENEKTIATFDIKKLKEQHHSILQEIEKLSKERKMLEDELKENEKLRKDSDAKLKEAKEQLSKKTSLIKETAELKSKLEFIDKEIQKIKDKGVKEKSALEKTLSQAKAELETLKKKEREAEQAEKSSFEKAAHHEAEMRAISKQVEEREKLLKEHEKKNRKEIEEKLSSNQESLKKQRGDCEANIASKNENQKWLTELKKHLSKCPICERELQADIREKILSEKESATKRLDSEIERQRHEIGKLEKVIESGTKELESVNRLEEKLKDYADLDKRGKEMKESFTKTKEENAKFKKAKAEVTEAVNDAKDKLSKLESEIENAERAERYISEKEKGTKSLKEKEQDASKITVTDDAVDKLQSEFTKINVKLKEISTKVDANTSSEKEKRMQEEEKKREIGVIEKMQEDIKEKKKVIENIAKFKNALEETQTTLRTKLIGSINGIMQEIWPELYPYGDYQSLLLEPTSDDYVLKVKTSREENKGWENVDAIASGGEKSVACLAMRVAFALVLVPNLRWIILDEPTHNIDQQGLGKFVKAISEVLPRLVEQVFIITHDEMLKQVVNSRIYVLSRNKAEDDGTVVEAY